MQNPEPALEQFSSYQAAQNSIAHCYAVATTATEKSINHYVELPASDSRRHGSEQGALNQHIISHHPNQEHHLNGPTCKPAALS
jgi:hypothetical protein